MGHLCGDDALGRPKRNATSGCATARRRCRMSEAADYGGFARERDLTRANTYGSARDVDAASRGAKEIFSGWADGHKRDGDGNGARAWVPLLSARSNSLEDRVPGAAKANPAGRRFETLDGFKPSSFRSSALSFPGWSRRSMSEIRCWGNAARREPSAQRKGERPNSSKVSSVGWRAGPISSRTIWLRFS